MVGGDRPVVCRGQAHAIHVRADFQRTWPGWAGGGGCALRYTIGELCGCTGGADSSVLWGALVRGNPYNWRISLEE